MVKILCVEDEAALREDLVEELRDAGYTIVEAANGQEGIEAIIKHNPALVISDITMPVMDGHMFLSTLREKYPEYAEVPFIFLSALADRKDVIDGKKLGADDYLTKPVDFDMLLATVETRLRQVTRMSDRKHEQMVKLYRALTGSGTDGEPIAGDVASTTQHEAVTANSITVVTLAHADDDLSSVHSVLDLIRQKIVKLNSAKEFFESVDKLSPDLLLLSNRATDMPARVVAKKIHEANKHAFPVILMTPGDQASLTDFHTLPGVSGILKLPCQRSVLAAMIAKLSK